MKIYLIFLLFLGGCATNNSEDLIDVKKQSDLSLNLALECLDRAKAAKEAQEQCCLDDVEARDKMFKKLLIK
jgi:hypothetical protein